MERFLSQAIAEEQAIGTTAHELVKRMVELRQAEPINEGIAYVVSVNRVPVILRLLTLNMIRVGSTLQESGSFPTAEGAQVAVDPHGGSAVAAADRGLGAPPRPPRARRGRPHRAHRSARGLHARSFGWLDALLQPQTV